MNRVETFFAECRRSVDLVLDRVIPTAKTAPNRLHEAIRWSIFAGGKRFRPALVMAVGDVFEVDRNKILTTAAAIEMVHTYSLIHDDLPSMDNDDLRRGRETCHVKFDEATAILAGDALQNLAFQIIAEDENLSSETKIKLITDLTRATGTLGGMVAGQQLDLEAEGQEISLDQLKMIHQYKTGAMISFSANAGAVIANANQRDTKAIGMYASKLGLLFQITDDLLDVTQTTETLGKTAGKDITARKATYPSFYGIEEAENLARKVHREACVALQKIEADAEILKLLADFILNRNT